jgi:hypothetical protein
MKALKNCGRKVTLSAAAEGSADDKAEAARTRARSLG